MFAPELVVECDPCGCGVLACHRATAATAPAMTSDPTMTEAMTPGRRLKPSLRRRRRALRLPLL